MQLAHILGLTLVVCALRLGAAAPARVLFDFESGFDASKIEARNVSASVSQSDVGAALRLRSGHKTA